MNSVDKELIQSLKKAIVDIENGTFQGVIWSSDIKNGVIYGKAVSGDMNDRINVLDLLFQSIYEESNMESRTWGMMEIYKRFKYYFGNLESMLDNFSGIKVYGEKKSETQV